MLFISNVISLTPPAGTQSGLVSTYEGHVTGQQWWWGWTKWTAQFAGETRVHNEAGLQPDQSTHRAQRAGECLSMYTQTDKLFLITNRMLVLHLNCRCVISWQFVVWGMNSYVNGVCLNPSLLSIFRWLSRGNTSSGLACWETPPTSTSTHSSRHERWGLLWTDIMESPSSIYAVKPSQP